MSDDALVAQCERLRGCHSEPPERLRNPGMITANKESLLAQKMTLEEVN